MVESNVFFEGFRKWIGNDQQVGAKQNGITGLMW